MAVGLPMLMLILALIVATQGAQQKASLALPVQPLAARQIAYGLRLYHGAAVAAKLANPGLSGTIVPTLPGFMIDNRFVACAGTKAVVTYGAGFTAGQSRHISDELLRQSLSPPELGLISPSSRFASPTTGTAQAGFAAGIGLTAGGLINNGYAAATAACVLPDGVAAIQTQLSP